MKLMAKRLNFTYDVAEPLTTELLGYTFKFTICTISLLIKLSLILRAGSAVADAVERRLADIGMAGVFITNDRLENIDMSVGHSRDCAAFITLASKALPK